MYIFSPKLMNNALALCHNSSRGVICGVLFFFTSFLNAQSGASLMGHPDSYQWKESAAIVQIIQQEKAETVASLAMQNLSDWSRAILEAYQSMLIYTLAEMPGQHDMTDALNKAFHAMQTEQVADPKSRAMVIDEMKVKQTELVQRLTNQ